MENLNLEKFLRRQAYKRISSELARFKTRMINQLPEKIYGAAYEIDNHICIYEQLVEKIEGFTEAQLRKFLKLPNVLGLFYDEWLSVEDSRNQELSNAIDMMIEKELNCNSIVGMLMNENKKGD